MRAEHIFIILLCVLATLLTRFLPFLIFSENKPTPKLIQFLGNALPSACFAFLIIYCLKDVSILSDSHGIPELISILVTAGIHLWRKNMFLSMAAGTVCYMILIQNIFV